MLRLHWRVARGCSSTLQWWVLKVRWMLMQHWIVKLVDVTNSSSDRSHLSPCHCQTWGKLCFKATMKNRSYIKELKLKMTLRTVSNEKNNNPIKAERQEYFDQSFLRNPIKIKNSDQLWTIRDGSKQINTMLGDRINGQKVSRKVESLKMPPFLS